ncbi:hypothetical protein NMG60_11013694 [Bertholletia excelsa]
MADSGKVSCLRHGRALERPSNFSQTCSLLSQYLKEKGTFGDLSLGITHSFEGNGMPGAAAAPTMNLFPFNKNSGDISGFPTRNAAPVSGNLSSIDLFPQQTGFGPSASEEEAAKKVDYISSGGKAEPEIAQLTIFYAGQVVVFNDFPADRAKEVMLLASKESSHNPSTLTSATPVQKPIEPINLLPTSSSSPAIPTFGNSKVQEHLQRPPQPSVIDLPIARKASLTRFLEKRKDRITARAPYPISDSLASASKSEESKSWLGLAAQAEQ